MLAGLLGVPLGAYLGATLLKRWPRAHPVICGVGLLISAPLFTLSIICSERYFYTPFALIFVGQIALNLNWSIVADMVLVRDSDRRDASSLPLVYFLIICHTKPIAFRGWPIEVVLFYLCCVASNFLSARMVVGLFFWLKYFGACMQKLSMVCVSIILNYYLFNIACIYEAYNI